MFNKSTIGDLAWMANNLPGYKPSESDQKRIDCYLESKKHAAWLARQELKEVDGFLPPFEGFYAGVDLWSDGAPAAYYESLNK